MVMTSTPASNRSPAVATVRPGTAGGIFPVGDDHRELMLLTQPRHQLLHRAPARLAHHIAYEQKIHGP